MKEEREVLIASLKSLRAGRQGRKKKIRDAQQRSELKSTVSQIERSVSSTKSSCKYFALFSLHCSSYWTEKKKIWDANVLLDVFAFKGRRRVFVSRYDASLHSPMSEVMKSDMYRLICFENEIEKVSNTRYGFDIWASALAECLHCL